MKKFFLIVVLILQLGGFAFAADEDETIASISKEECSYKEKVVVNISKAPENKYSVCLAILSCTSSTGRKHFHKMPCESEGGLCPQTVSACLDNTSQFRLENTKPPAGQQTASVDIAGKPVSYRVSEPWVVGKQINGKWSWACATPVKWPGAQKNETLPVRACNANGPEGGKLEEMSCPVITGCNGGLAFETRPKLADQIAAVKGESRKSTASNRSGTDSFSGHSAATAH